MPKQKTRKALARRIKVTKTGKVLKRGSHIRHLRLKKSKKNIRRQKLMRAVESRIAIKIKKLLPKS